MASQNQNIKRVVGRTQVRSALATYLAPPAISGINQVFTSMPKRINFQVNALPSQINRCAAVIFIESEAETRIANGGVNSGWKRIDYTVVIQLFHHSLEREAEDAMADLDQTIDDLKELLRDGQHRLSDDTGVLIWQAAEPDIDATYGEPLSQNGTSIETWASIRFTVTQMIAV
jgi:hypothetical protein